MISDELYNAMMSYSPTEEEAEAFAASVEHEEQQFQNTSQSLALSEEDNAVIFNL